MAGGESGRDPYRRGRLARRSRRPRAADPRRGFLRRGAPPPGPMAHGMPPRGGTEPAIDRFTLEEVAMDLRQRPVSEIMRREVVTVTVGEKLDLTHDVMNLGR